MMTPKDWWLRNEENVMFKMIYLRAICEKRFAINAFIAAIYFRFRAELRLIEMIPLPRRAD